MPGPKPIVALAIALLLAAVAAAQFDVGEERPRPYPTTRKVSKKDLDRRESLYRYTYGLLCERDDRLLEALKSFEEAAQLDSESVDAFRAQVPLLVLLDRAREALDRTRTVLQLSPLDHEAWFLAARLHKSLGEMKDYRNALEKGLAVPGLAQEHPGLAQQLYIDLGHYLEATETPAEAIRAYTEAAKILDHPDQLMEHGPFQREAIVTKAAETYEKIGHLERGRKDYAAAMKAYRTALERQPADGGRINLHLARLSAEQGQPGDALRYLEGFLRLQPQGAEPYQFKIELLGKLGRGTEVLPWLEQTSRTDPLNMNLRLLLGQEYAASRKLDEAERVFRALMDESPSEEVYRGFFGLYRKTPRVVGERILAELDRSVRLASKKPPEAGTVRAGDQTRAMLNILRDDAELSRALLDAAFRPGQGEPSLHYETRYFLAVLSDKYARLEQAEAFYRQALTAPDQVNEAPLYSGLLRVLWKSKKYDEVIVLCRQGLERSRFTNHLLFYGDLARALARQGKLREAEAAAEQAFRAAGDREQLFAAQLKIRILLQAQKYREAETLGKKLLEEATVPGDVQEMRYLLSSVYSSWRKLAQAEKLLGEILKTDPANVTVNNDLGYIWADQSKNLTEAEAMIRKAIELDRRQRKTGASEDQDNAAYVDSLGWVLFRRGDLDGARKELERAVALPDGDDPTLWDHLADVYFRMERYLQAQTAWERSIELYEKEKTRPQDERYRDVQRKMRMVRELVGARK